MFVLIIFDLKKGGIVNFDIIDFFRLFTPIWFYQTFVDFKVKGLQIKAIVIGKATA